MLGAAFDERGVRYLLALVLPLAALSLAAPLALVIAAPEIALNLLSSVSTQTSVEQHYAAGATPGLVVAAIFGAARLVAREAATGPAARRGRRRRGAASPTSHLGALPLWGGRRGRARLGVGPRRRGPAGARPRAGRREA